jgi:3-hydroxyacyl-[acyl-carrier-protein] dehydratase
MNPVREQIRSMLRVENREGGFRALFDLDPGLNILRDHFPNRPILPGICMIQAVLLAGAERQGAGDLRVRQLKNAKWLQPIEPGQQVVIDAEMIPANDGDFHIKAKLSVSEKRCAEFSIVARPIAADEGARP